MKKALLSALFAFGALGANAQLADGSVAPDFTATDINGVPHTLSEYLNAGKTVIIDISATWCGPCWAYHHTGALEDIYNAYGELGSDEIVVLFIEGDPGTSVQSIYGTNTASDVSVTQGDWTIGSPYPIIDDTTGSISNAYNIAYFPTVYRICPDGFTKELTQPSAAAIKTSVNNGCSTLTGVQNHGRIATDNLRLCDASAVVKAKLKNYGTNKITAATVVIEQNGAVVATKNYTGNLTQFSTSLITFDALNFDPANTYDVKVTNINTVAPYSTDLTVDPFTISVSPVSNNHIQVNCYTDNYPGEISWNISDSQGNVVAYGGPYTAGPGTGGSGGADANTMISADFDIPAGTIECYTVTMVDSFGDGWALSSSEFQGLEVLSSNGTIFHQEAGNFGTSLVTTAAFKTNGVLSTTNVTAKEFALYPNPTSGVLNFSTQEAIDVTIVDVTGKTVFTAKGINDGQSINLGNLQKGLYIAQLKGATTQATQKIIIN